MEINNSYEARIPLLKTSNTSLPMYLSIVEKTEFIIAQYDEMCEDFSKIDKLVSINYSKIKIAFYVLLNIITLFTINLFVIWFPTLKFYFLFSKAKLRDAKYVGIYGNDHIFHIEELREIELPNILDSPLIKHCRNNIHEATIKMFQFKYYEYVYDPMKENFASVDFLLTCTHEKIHKHFSKGLNPQEFEYQKKLFSKGDIDVKVDSSTRIFFSSIVHPFYVYTVCSIILWYFNDYAIYANCMVVATAISLVVEVLESKNIQKSIKEMSNYSLSVKVFRRDNSTPKPALFVKSKKDIKNLGSVNLSTKNFVQVNSDELVPGDLIEIPLDGSIMPCDALLLSGSVVINEALLTGESTPVFKVSVSTNNNYNFHERRSRSNIVHAGTKIIQARKGAKGMALGLVLNTGFNTEKGNLVRSIIYPKDTEVKFKVDAMKFVYVMAAIAVIEYIICIPSMMTTGISTTEMIFRGLDLFTDTVPPSLPFCIGIGITFSIMRLKDKGIRCVSRERISDIGKVDLICLDKTGTLTEEELEITRFRRTKLESNLFLFNNSQESIRETIKEAFTYYKERIHGAFREKISKSKELKLMFAECVASCHNISKVNDQLIGDPIDLEMFKASGWTFVETNEDDTLIQSSVRPKEEKPLLEKLMEAEPEQEDQIIKDHYELVIVKRFDFSSKLQRMSVIAKNPNEDIFKIFTKGSPEKIQELCRSDTVPINFNEILNKYTSQGYRVLGLAGKPVKMSYLHSNNIERAKLESNMVFLGLMIINNKLKEKTIETIEELQEANQKMLMATGDNILTAIAVSKACKLISKEAQIFTCKIEKDEKTKKYNILWEEIEKYEDPDEVEKSEDIEGISKKRSSLVDDDNSELSADEYASELGDEEELRQLIMEKEEENNQLMLEELKFQLEEGPEYENIQILFDPKKMTNFMEEDFIIAVQGSTFETLWKLRNNYVKNKDKKFKEYYDLFRLILQNTAIYARMAPDHKTILVESLKEENFIVLMCGDGANDCGALKASNVGISLTKENSISSHFTSEVQDISCLTEVLREGKCSLVTSICCFKAMILYSMIQSISVTFLLIIHTYLLDSQFLSADILIVPALQVLMAYTEPASVLSAHQPIGDLLTFPILTSVISQTVIQITFLYIGHQIISQMPLYRTGGCLNPKDLDDPRACDKNTVKLSNNY